MNVPRLDKEIGIEAYATKTLGIGGRLRQVPEDFTVKEVLINGSIAETEPCNIPHITGHGRYIVCVLVKRKMDTFQAVQAIANKLGIETERIHIAGIKDANALTAQHVSISRMLPERVAQIKTDKLWLYPIRFSNEKIHSGLLFGNQFHINIRAISHSASGVIERLENTMHELHHLGGCPNFFGHQRFGTTRPITHLVGKQILLGEWERAALAFLAQPSAYEHPESREARQRLWNTQNYKEAFSEFPPKLVYERQMLRHLATHQRDFIGAFHRIPKKLLQLFIQAYQSYLFNRFLCQRIRNEMPLKKPRAEEYRLRINGEDCVALPLVGWKQGLSKGKQGQIERKILRGENIASQNFKISAMPEISSKGGLRTTLTPIIDLSIETPSEDNMNSSRKMVSLRLTLRKGSYATTVLRELMKPRNPIKARF